MIEVTKVTECLRNQRVSLPVSSVISYKFTPLSSPTISPISANPNAAPTSSYLLLLLPLPSLLPSPLSSSHPLTTRLHCIHRFHTHKSIVISHPHGNPLPPLWLPFLRPVRQPGHAQRPAGLRQDHASSFIKGRRREKQGKTKRKSSRGISSIIFRLFVLLWYLAIASFHSNCNAVLLPAAATVVSYPDLLVHRYSVKGESCALRHPTDCLARGGIGKTRKRKSQPEIIKLET
ncbi:hypothetical protein F4780DRAFT_365910 [Xylariomycetidae sp. FL0641]|nr:hypothetical protein F4780DRAFT_365910 [Xylariomycetidae sp. FL0641]